MSDARYEVEGMTAVPDTSEPWVTRLVGPHPPAVSRAVGALLTCTLSRTQALMVAYTLADAGLLAWDSPTQMLREFSAATGGDDRPYAEWAKLRLDLLREEVGEFVEALESGDVAAIAREGADVEYVVHGTMVRLGVDLDAAFREVHRANMSKVGPDGMFIVREDGKILKPDGFTPPDMSCAVADAVEPEVTYTAGLPHIAGLEEYVRADPGWRCDAPPPPFSGQFVRDLAHVPDSALKMRLAQLLAHREQCCASESDCDVGWELADLRWVLARRAESAGSTP